MRAVRGPRRQAAVLVALVAVLIMAASAPGAGARGRNTIVFQPFDPDGGLALISSDSAAQGVEVDLVPDSPPLPKAIRIDVPRGYTLDLDAKPGDEVGEVSVSIVGADAQSFATGFGSLVAQSSSDSAGGACVPGPHDAVWTFTTSLAAQQVTMTVVVDRADDERSYVLNVCPSRLVSNTSSAASIELSFYGLTVPSSPGDYRWRAVVTPRTRAAYELQAVVPLPAAIDVHARHDRRHKRAIVSGRVTEKGQPLAGTVIVISPRRTNGRPLDIAVTRTNANGRFSKSIRITGTTDFRVFAVGSMEPCAPASDPALECLGSTIVAPDAGAVTLWVSRPTGAKRGTRAADQRRADAIGLKASDFPSDFNVTFSGADECLNPKHESKLVITGETTSPAFFHYDLEPPTFLQANNVARVYASAKQARTALHHQARTSTVRCILNNLELETPVRPFRVSGLDASARAFRTTATDQGLTLNYDVVFLQRGRALTIVQLALINAPDDFESRVLTAVASRMR